MIRKTLFFTLSLMLVLALLFTGCTKRNNLTGDNWSNMKPLTTVDTSFVMGYSYTHTGKVTGYEQHLLCGTADGLTAMSVMKFTDMPDPEDIVITGQPTLTIVASRRSPLGRNPLMLSFHKLAADWAADSTSSINDADISPLAVPDFQVPEVFPADDDTTLTIDLPSAVINAWPITDVDGFNLVIKAVNSGWVEFKSNELTSGAYLNFTYHLVGDTTTVTYKQHPIKDSYKITGEQTSITANSWKLRNLLPQRMYMKFNLPNNIFTYQDSTLSDSDNILTDTDRKRMTINKAELVLYVKNNPYYQDTYKAYFYPYYVKKDAFTEPVAFIDDDLMYVPTYTYSTGVTITGDSVKIDVTSTIQAFTSGDVDNQGIVVKLTTEMQNFGNLEFWHYADAPAGKKPYVKIAYSAPYLKGD